MPAAYAASLGDTIAPVSVPVRTRDHRPLPGATLVASATAGAMVESAVRTDSLGVPTSTCVLPNAIRDYTLIIPSSDGCATAVVAAPAGP